MQTLEQILRHHARKYPQMQPTDAVKLIYQNVFGGGHLIREPAACRCALRHEYEDTPQIFHSPLLENIGNGMVRVMLSAIDGSGYSIEQLGYDFVRSSREHQGSLNGFLLKLDILRRVAADGAFGFSLEELENYLREYQKAGYPMVSHSEQYRKAYRPAYRIVLERLLPEKMTIEAGRNKL